MEASVIRKFRHSLSSEKLTSVEIPHPVHFDIIIPRFSHGISLLRPPITVPFRFIFLVDVITCYTFNPGKLSKFNN